MDSSIVASVISAALSAITALISVRRRSIPGNIRYDRHANNLRWISGFFLLVLWLGASPLLIRWDIPNLNVLVIIAVTLILAFFFPIRAGMAAAIVLLLHPANFFLPYIGKSLHDVVPDPSSSSPAAFDNPTVLLLLSIDLTNAMIVSLLCWWRGRVRVSRKSRRGSARERPVAGDLERIALLHSRGILTDEEFEAAKRRMLGI